MKGPLVFKQNLEPTGSTNTSIILKLASKDAMTLNVMILKLASKD